MFEIKRFELKIEDDYLVAAITYSKIGTSTQILRTVNENEAISEGLGRSMGETICIVNDDA